MPFKFFSVQHLRFLNSSFMKSNSRGYEVFSRVFPHKLKYQSSSSNKKLGLQNLMMTSAAQSYSTKGSKSLIEDEAELSDWVSELKSDSFKKSRLYSESDNNDNHDNDNDWKRRKREIDSRGKSRSGAEFGSRRDNSRGDLRGGGIGRSDRGGELERRNDRFSRDLNNKGNGRSFDGARKGKEAFTCDKKGEDGGRFVSKSGRGGKSMIRETLMVSDGSDVEEVGRKNVMNKFRELISDDDEDENDDDIDVDDGGILEKPVVVNAPRISPDGSESYLSEKRFDECAVSPLSLKAIKDAGYEKMTVVQEATLPVILKGKDVLAKARTGTGKTVAFLLPSIEVVVKSPAVGRDQKRAPIQVLIICPTRELASQAAMEANKLIKYYTSVGVQLVIGGTRLGLEQ